MRAVFLSLLAVGLVSQASAAPQMPAPAANVVHRAAAIIPLAAERTPVFVEHAGRDAAGRAFVDSLRTALRTSKQFALADSDSSATILLVVVSVSPEPGAGGVASAVSLAYVANNEWRTLLGSAARFVGRDRAEEMGRDTLTELAAVLSAYEARTR